MRKIMDISDVLEVKNRGIVVGGADRALDTLTPDQIRDLIGTEVEIRSSGGAQAQYRVLGVQITNSLVNQKNVFILLPPETNKEDIEVGAEVYSLTGNH